MSDTRYPPRIVTCKCGGVHYDTDAHFCPASRPALPESEAPAPLISETRVWKATNTTERPGVVERESDIVAALARVGIERDKEAPPGEAGWLVITENGPEPHATLGEALAHLERCICFEERARVASSRSDAPTQSHLALMGELARVFPSVGLASTLPSAIRFACDDYRAARLASLSQGEPTT